MIAKMLQLSPGMRLIEIGAGCGALAKYLADNYHVHVVGTTLSKAELDYARKFCVGSTVDMQLSNCTDLMENEDEKFDGVIVNSVLECIGKSDYERFFANIANLLKNNGTFVIQVAGRYDSRLGNVNGIYPLVRFANLSEIITATEKYFVMESLTDVGRHYEKTFLAWGEKDRKYRDTFVEKYGQEYCPWSEFFTQMTATMAKLRILQEWQIVFSKKC